MLTFLIIILCLEILLVFKIVKFYVLSQVHLYLLFYLGTIILTSLYYYHYDDKISLYRFDYIKEGLFIETIKLHLFALVAFLAGVIVYYDLSRKSKKLIFNKSFSKVLFYKFNLPEKINIVIIVLFLIILILYASTYGLRIFYREDYLISDGRAIQTITKLLSFVLSILLAFNYTTNRAHSIVTFSMLLLLTIGTGSRIAFLYFVIYVFLIFQSQGNTIKNKLILFVNLILAFLLLSFIMSLRIGESHGVFPYLAKIFDSKDEFTESLSFNIYYSFIFGIFVSAKTILLNVPDWNNIIVSLNPLTGKMAGWYDIAESMRIYPIVPYSSNGEVFTMGNSFTFLFYLILGCIVSHFDYKTRNLFAHGKRILGFIIVILFLLYVVYSFEYNLRSSFRYIYYIYILLFVFSIKLKKIRV